MKAVWIGAFAISLLASIADGRAFPVPPLGSVVAIPTAPLMLVRHHHHHHGHWRRGHSHETDEAEPEAATPGVPAPADNGALSGSGQPAPTAPVTNRRARGSGSSGPAIRWVDPEKSPR
jgi:hypothetical protein